MSIATRRYPRFTLDVDWFVESNASSSMGRGLEISARSAMLPVTCTSPFTANAILHLSLPQRPKMFRAMCSAKQQTRGWVLHFEAVTPDDLQLLGQALVAEFGPASLPNLLHRPDQTLNL